MLLAQQTDVPDACLVSCTTATVSSTTAVFGTYVLVLYSTTAVFGTYVLVLHSTTAVFGTYVLVLHSHRDLGKLR